MNRNYALMLAASCCTATAMAQQQPHIILIMTDQQRFDALGCMGNDAVISPHIDALAAQGTLFMCGYTSCPSSTPARSALLTGLSPWHHGMLGYGRGAVRYPYEMPRMLRQAGYYTYGIGKMHWNPQRNGHGFEGLLLDESGRVEDPYFVSDYRQWFRQHAPGSDPDATGLGWNAHGARVYRLAEELHPTYWTGEMACQFIHRYDDSRPLFLKVSFARPHSPYDPPQRLLDLYKDRPVPPRAVGDWCGRYAQQLDPDTADPSAAHANFGETYAQNSKRYYYANVTFIDEQVGRIVDELKRKGMYDNALILFVSDHGDMMGDHHHWRKTYPFEGSVHVPYLVKWPMAENVRPGKVMQPVELRDVLPTFLQAAGVAVPDSMDGRPLQTLVHGDGTGWRKYIDMEHSRCYAADEDWCGLTDGRLKYVWYFYDGREMLFDLVKDPYELHNAAADKAYAKSLADMRQALASHLSERGEDYVKDGRLAVRRNTILYSPCFPKNRK